MTTDPSHEPDPMRSEVWAALTLTGRDLDPNQVTETTGMVPSRIWRRGDPIRGTLRYEIGGWSVRSPLSVANNLEEHVRALLTAIGRSWPALVSLGRVYDAELECV